MKFSDIKARTLICDPAWPGMGAPYRSMPLSRIRQLPVGELAAESAQLLLWCPGSLVGKAIEIAEQNWGFTYHQTIVWLKSRPGRPTRYLMPITEFLLYFARGGEEPLVRGQQTLIVAPTLGHSEKPAEGHVIAERLGRAPFVELFARQRPSSSERWLIWGDEVPSDFAIPDFPVPADFLEEAA